MMKGGYRIYHLNRKVATVYGTRDDALDMVLSFVSGGAGEFGDYEILEGVTV